MSEQSPFRKLRPLEAKLITLAKELRAGPLVLTFLEVEYTDLSCHWYETAKGRKSRPCVENGCCKEFGPPDHHAAIAALRHVVARPPADADARSRAALEMFRALSEEERRSRIAKVPQVQRGTMDPQRALAEHEAALAYAREYQQRPQKDATLEHVMVDMRVGFARSLNRRLAGAWRGATCRLSLGADGHIISACQPELTPAELPTPLETAVEFFSRLWNLAGVP